MKSITYKKADKARRKIHRVDKWGRLWEKANTTLRRKIVGFHSISKRTPITPPHSSQDKRSIGDLYMRYGFIGENFYPYSDLLKSGLKLILAQNIDFFVSS